MDKDLIEKYLQGKASKAEIEQVLRWASESKDNEKYLHSQKLAHVFSNFPNSDTTKSDMEKFSQRYYRKSYIQYFRYVAAALFFPLLAFSIYQYVSSIPQQSASTPLPPSFELTEPSISYTVNPGVKGRVVLPDGSCVWLNSSSTLKHPSVFSTAMRTVELDGEAFFDVKPNAEWPMYISTNKGVVVEVTGTKFNIRTYENDDCFSLLLVSGKVRLINENNKTAFDVLPNQDIYIKNDEQTFRLKEKFDEHVNTSWKDGYLVFDATLFSDVVKKIERWYGVTIKVTDEQILNEKFTAEFKSESLTQVLDFFKTTSAINYTIADSTIFLSY